MKLEDAVKHFKTQRKIADILGIEESNMAQWKKRNNGLVPMKYILRLKDMSNGELDLCLDDYREGA